MPLDLMSNSDQLDLYLSFDSYAQQLQTKLAIAYGWVATNTEMSIRPHKINHDRKVRACVFNQNDYVWKLDETKTKGVCKKLSEKYTGPYLVTEVIDDNNYKIKPLKGNRQTIVNKCKLKRCFPRNILLNHDQSNSSTQPRPIIWTRNKNIAPNPKHFKHVQEYWDKLTTEPTKPKLISRKSVHFNDQDETVTYQSPNDHNQEEQIPIQTETRNQSKTRKHNRRKHGKQRLILPNDTIINPQLSNESLPSSKATNEQRSKRNRRPPDFFQAGQK
jgi:hypothetical protein